MSVMSHKVQSIFRAAIKLSNSSKTLIGKNVLAAQVFHKQIPCTRNLWSLANPAPVFIIKSNEYVPVRKAHGKAEQELIEFLTEEVLAERKAQKTKTLPTKLDGFNVELNGAQVIFTQVSDKERVKISFNINHTVDTDIEPEVHPNMDKSELGELKSKPSFKIEITRDNTTLCLLCSFIEATDREEGYTDLFGIDEISIYDGEWNENVYAVSGDVLDTYLYDLILNYLEEKGISNEFVEKLSNYSTGYEHSAYIGLLEGLSKFVSGK